MSRWLLYQWLIFSSAVLERGATISLNSPMTFLAKSLALHLPNLTSHLNSTIGHSDAVMALGMEPFGGGMLGGSSTGELSTAELLTIIPNSLVNSTLENALLLVTQSAEEIQQAGWKVVHKSDLFSLYKRRTLPNNQGPVEYLMTGKIADVSPRTFLHAQISCECRRAWDNTMKEMTPGSLDLIEGGVNSQDSLYYRTKWPWPLKDRDYTLARRCRVFEDKKALVFISRSTELSKHPRIDGVIRVDNYWSSSAIFADKEVAAAGAGAAGHSPPPTVKRQTLAERAKAREASKKAEKAGGFFGKFGGKKGGGSGGGVGGGGDKESAGATGGAGVSSIDVPGLSFVSIFCDDHRVPLHPRIVDMIAHQAEKVVPDSIAAMYAVAKQVEQVRALSGLQKELPTPADFAVLPTPPPPQTKKKKKQ